MSHGLLSPISLVPSAWSALPLPTHPSQSYPCIVSVSEGDCNFPFRCDCARIFFFSEGLRVVAMQCYVAVAFVIGSITNGDGCDKSTNQ